MKCIYRAIEMQQQTKEAHAGGVIGGVREVDCRSWHTTLTAIPHVQSVIVAGQRVKAHSHDSLVLLTTIRLSGKTNTFLRTPR